MAKRPGTPIATWLGGRRSRIASRAADGSRLQIKRLKSGDFAACTIDGEKKSCGIVPAGASVQDVRRNFRSGRAADVIHEMRKHPAPILSPLVREMRGEPEPVASDPPEVSGYSEEFIPGAGVTNRGYQVHAPHPMAKNGYRYRARKISGFTHVDEYVAPMGQWVYLGWLRK